jgi:hypothetical protein
MIDQKRLSEIWDSLTDFEKKELTKIIEELDRLGKEWKALPGPQTLALESDADIILYGGAAGGGKSYLAIGKALTQHKRVLILRREFPQLAGLLETAREIYEPYGKYTANPQPTFRLNYHGQKKLIEFGSCQHDKDKTKYQGRAHDLRVLDEAANFLESQVDFISGWIRSEDPKQKCQLLLLSNPPSSSEGQWLFDWFAPWLDEKHPNPASPGELRWFAKINGKDTEVKDERPFLLDGENIIYDFSPSEHSAADIIVPKSRTFIPARVTDNPFYVASGYISTLQSMPEPLRSQMLYGDFLAGREDDAWQVIPTEWVKLAQERWRNTVKPDRHITSMGVDVARGGKDKTVITLRSGNYVFPQIVHPGTATPDGPKVAELVVKEATNICQIFIDIIGVGSSVYDFTKSAFSNNPAQKSQVHAFNGACAAREKTKNGLLEFVNLRAQAYWQLREALDPTSGENICLPDDRELLADLTAPTWSLKAGGIQIESKEDIIERIHRSPDKGDSCVYAFVKPVRAASFADINIMGR